MMTEAMRDYCEIFLRRLTAEIPGHAFSVRDTPDGPRLFDGETRMRSRWTSEASDDLAGVDADELEELLIATIKRDLAATSAAVTTPPETTALTPTR